MKLMVLILTIAVRFGDSEKTGYINRIKSQRDGSFVKAVDSFGNLRRDEAFCTSTNAICSGTKCETCICEVDTTFISYHHGCMSLQKSNHFLNAVKCLQHSNKVFAIPAVASYRTDRCLKLVYPKAVNRFGMCKTQYLSKITVVNGSAVNMTDKHFDFQRKRFKTCLQRIKRSDYLPSGSLFKLHITCPIDQSQSYMNTCFVFKTLGFKTVAIANDVADPHTTIKTTQVAITEAAAAPDFLKTITFKSVAITSAVVVLSVLIVATVCWRVRRQKTIEEDVKAIYKVSPNALVKLDSQYPESDYYTPNVEGITNDAKTNASKDSPYQVVATAIQTEPIYEGSFHRKRGSKVPEAPTMHYAALQGAEENYYQVETEYQGLEKHQISSVNNYAYEYPE